MTLMKQCMYILVCSKSVCNASMVYSTSIYTSQLDLIDRSMLKKIIR